MPVIATFPDPTRAYVRVETNWADTPAVEFVKVLRVDSVTGVCVPLRPYICFDGDYLAASCGHAIFWDTEVPLDRQVFYVTQGLNAPCVPAQAIEYDLFGRTVAASWGTATSGQAYVQMGGAAADYAVDGARGTISVTATSVDRAQRLDVGQPNQDVRIDLITPVTPTGGSSTQGVAIRLADTNNFYRATASISTAGVVSAQLSKRVAGSLTTISTLATTLTTGGGGDLILRAQALGTTIRMKIWPSGSTEPTAWTLSAADTSLATGDEIAAYARREAAEVTPTIFTFDNLYVTDPCAPCEEVTATSDPLTMGSDGKFRLKDPVRPCRDLAVPLCFDQVASADCLPGSGVFFASMSTESFATNSMSVNPTNAEFPLAISRTRRGVASTLTLVARTFADRDALKLITKPGSPLLFQGPPQYGIPDRYMDVGDTDFERGLTDHKFQVRTVALPHVEVARPAGPSLGVCGSRLKDLCDTYATWQEIVDAGLNWDDLVRGRAGQPDPTTAFRTWDDVLAEFADWDDVNDGTRTWQGLEVGD